MHYQLVWAENVAHVARRCCAAMRDLFVCGHTAQLRDVWAVPSPCPIDLPLMWSLLHNKLKHQRTPGW